MSKFWFGGEERDDHADHQADVAGAGGEERLERRVGVRLLLPPVADQHEGAETDQLPADEQLQGVRRDDEREHRRGEEAQRGVEVGVADVVVHVRRRVDVHEQRDQRDDEEHHHGEAVDLGADGERPAPPLCHHVTVCTTGVHDGLVLAAGSDEALAERLQRFEALLAAGVLDPLDPLDRGDARQHEGRADGGDADLGSVLRHLLAEEQDQEERQHRDGGDDPRVVEHGCLSALQLFDAVEVGAVEVAVDEQHDREPDADLGRRDRDDEQREDLAGRVRAGRPRTRRG